MIIELSGEDCRKCNAFHENGTVSSPPTARGIRPMRIFPLAIAFVLAAASTARQDERVHEVADSMPGILSLLTPGGRSGEAKAPPGTQVRVGVHFHDSQGHGHDVAAEGRWDEGATNWSFAIGFGGRDPVGQADVVVELWNENGTVAAPVLRRIEIPLGEKPALAHPYRFERFWESTRLTHSAKAAPIEKRLNPKKLEVAGVDFDKVTHGVVAYPVEFLVTSESAGTIDAVAATIDAATADYFGGEGLIGLGGKFIEFAKPCEAIQIFLDEPASVWGHWIGAPRDREFVPSRWKLACDVGRGNWEVIAEGGTHAERSHEEHPMTLGALASVTALEAPRFILAAFAERPDLVPLGERPTCPVELPR